MNRGFRFFDFLEIVDELNVGSPWTLETSVLRNDNRALFKSTTAFWVIMTFWTFFIFQIALIIMIYHKVPFDDEDMITLPQIFLFVHSFVFVIFIVSAPICVLKFLAPKTLKVGIYDMYFTVQLLRMPYYVRKVRKKNIINDHADFDPELEMWDFFWFW